MMGMFSYPPFTVILNEQSEVKNLVTARGKFKRFFADAQNDIFSFPLKKSTTGEPVVLFFLERLTS